MRQIGRTLIYLIFFLAPILPANAERIKLVEKMWIADFERPQIAKYFDVWDHNVLDSNQSIKMQIINGDSAQKIDGKSLQLNFDVDSPNPAMVGFLVRLKNQDLSAFDVLHLSLKVGDQEYFTGNIAVQFTDVRNRKAPYFLSKISTTWQEYRIPLVKFRRITDWSVVKEFEIIIDDVNAQPKEGVLLVDEIYVSKGSL